LFIWRPILADKVTLGEVMRGDVDIVALQKLNSMLDYRDAMNHREAERMKAEGKRK